MNTCVPNKSLRLRVLMFLSLIALSFKGFSQEELDLLSMGISRQPILYLSDSLYHDTADVRINTFVVNSDLGGNNNFLFTGSVQVNDPTYFQYLGNVVLDHADSIGSIRHAYRFVYNNFSLSGQPYTMIYLGIAYQGTEVAGLFKAFNNNIEFGRCPSRLAVNRYYQWLVSSTFGSSTIPFDYTAADYNSLGSYSKDVIAQIMNWELNNSSPTVADYENILDATLVDKSDVISAFCHDPKSNSCACQGCMVSTLGVLDSVLSDYPPHILDSLGYYPWESIDFNCSCFGKYYVNLYGTDDIEGYEFILSPLYAGIPVYYGKVVFDNDSPHYALSYSYNPVKLKGIEYSGGTFSFVEGFQQVFPQKPEELFPNLTISPSGPVAICSGDTVTLGTDSLQLSNIHWNTGDTIRTARISSGGTYTVQATGISGCTSYADSVVVTVNPNPTADAGADTTVYKSRKARLGGTGVTGGNAPYSYSWNPVTGLDDSLAQNPVVLPNATSIYFLTVKDSNGCKGNDSVLVTVLPIDTPMLKPITDPVTGLSDSIHSGQRKTMGVVYINQGPIPFEDSLSIDGGFDCINSLKIRTLKVFVGNNSIPSYVAINPVFPIGVPYLLVNSGQTFRIDQDIELESDTSLADTLCTAALKLNWGCNTTGCDSTVPVPLRLLATPSGPAQNKVSVSLITPDQLNTCVDNTFSVTIAYSQLNSSTPTQTASFDVNINFPADIINNSDFSYSYTSTSLPLSLFSAPVVSGNKVVVSCTSVPNDGTSYNFEIKVTPKCSIIPAQQIPNQSFSIGVDVSGLAISNDIELSEKIGQNQTLSTVSTSITSDIPFYYPFITNTSNNGMNFNSLTAFGVNAISTTYTNSGLGDYSAPLQITIPDYTPSGVTITGIQIIVNGTTVLNDNSPVFSASVYSTSAPISVPHGGTMTIVQTLTLGKDICITSATAFQSSIVVGWGCPNDLCRNTDQVVWTLRSSDAPAITIYRVLPIPVAPASYPTNGLANASTSNHNDVPWENQCFGGSNNTEEWEFLIKNKGSGRAKNVILSLNFSSSTSTYILENSIYYSDVVNQLHQTSSDQTPGNNFTISNSQTATVSTNFNWGSIYPGNTSTANPLAVGYNTNPNANCFSNTDDPVKVYNLALEDVDPDQELILHFTTTRCCPSNINFGTPISFNKWTLSARCYNECNTPALSPPNNAYTYNVQNSQQTSIPSSSGSGSVVLYPHRYEISAERLVGRNNADLGVVPLILPQPTGITFPHNVSSTPYVNSNGVTIGPLEFNLINDHFVSDDQEGNFYIDPMLFCQSGFQAFYGSNPTFSKLIGLSPKGDLIVRVTSITPSNITFSNPGTTIENGSTIWNPSSSTSIQTSIPITTAGLEFVFHIGDLNFATSQEFNDFFQGSVIRYKFNANCTGNRTTTKLKIETFLRPYDVCTAQCIIPLVKDENDFVIQCPGCVTPGAVVDTTYFRRTTLGYQDSDNDGIPDIDNQSNVIPNPLKPIDYGGQYLAQHPSVATYASVIGDELTSYTSAYLQVGDHTDGFTLSDWVNAWTSNTGWSGNGAGILPPILPRISRVILQQDVSAAQVVGLTCIGGAATYNHGTNRIRINIPATDISTINVTGGSKRYIIRLTDVEFGIQNSGFLEDDKIQFELKFKSCTNPSESDPEVKLHVRSACYFMTNSMNSTFTNNYAAQTDFQQIPQLGDNFALAILNNPTISHPLAVSPDQYVTLFCSSDDYDHFVYRIETEYRETWSDPGGCDKNLSIKLLSKVAGLTDNKFKYEYRLMPGVDILRGLTIADNANNPFAIKIKDFANYSITPIGVESWAPNYSNSNNTRLYKSGVDLTSNPLAITGLPNSGFIEWSTNYSQLGFAAPYSTLPTISTSGYFDLSGFDPTSQKLNLNGKHGLLLGDEFFQQITYFKVKQKCTEGSCTTQANGLCTTTIDPGDAFARVSSAFAPVCGSSANTVDRDWITTPSPQLITPRPTLTSNPILTPTFVGNHVFYSMTITFTNPAATAFPNLVCYIDLPSAPGSIIPGLPSGMHLSQVSLNPTFSTTLIPVNTQINPYVRYYITGPTVGTTSGGVYTVYFDFQIDNCDVLNCDPTTVSLPPYCIDIPIYYAWSCDYDDLKYLPAIPNNQCFTTPQYSTAQGVIPVIQSQSFGHTASASTTFFSGCSDVTLNYCMSSQAVGGIGNFIANLSLPAGISVTSASLSLSTGGASVPISRITSHTSAIAGWNDFQIDISDRTAFCNRIQPQQPPCNSVVGGDGLNSADGTLCLTIIMHPNCGSFIMPSSGFFDVPLTITGDRYCNIGGRDIVFNESYHFDQPTNCAQSNCPISIDQLDVACTTRVVTFNLCANANIAGTTITLISPSNAHTNIPLNTLTNSYELNNAQNPLNPGSYVILITDGNGHCNSRGFTIPSAQMTISATVTDVGCKGEHTGAIKVTSPTGSGVSYAWSTAPTVSGPQILTGLVAGTYYVTVRDGCGVSGSTSFPVSEPLLPLSGSLASNPAQCFGGNNGSIRATANGGTSPYSYTWNTSPSQTTQSISGGAGSYTVTIKDHNGCLATTSGNISQPTDIIVSESVNNITCHGSHNGKIEITSVSGGTSPYTYSWSTSSTQSHIQNLGAGTYSLTVKDANNCEKTIQYTITEPAQELSVSLDNYTDANCYGVNTGVINVNVSGGTSSYTFNWDNNQQTTQNATGLAIGSHTLIVTDANGCQQDFTRPIAGPMSPFTATITPENESCPSGNDGTLQVNVSGGQPVYSYSWNNSAFPNSPTLNGLTTGTYTVTVSDFYSCTTSASTSITSTYLSCCTPDNPTLSSSQNRSLTFGDINSTDFLTTINTLFPNSGYVSGNSLTNFPYQIVIQGTLTLNADLDFNLCPNITFGQTGAIWVDAGYDLTIEQSNLYACSDYMWRGITVNHPNSRITVSGLYSEIRDAEAAITLQGRGEGDVSDCHFFNDWIGIQVKGQVMGPYGTIGGLGPAHFSVTGSEFRTTTIGNLKITGLNNTSSAQGDIGIKITDVNGTLIIGDTRHQDHGNIFMYINCGIYSMKSSIFVLGNDFIHLPFTTISGKPEYWGRGIYYRSNINNAYGRFPRLTFIVGQKIKNYFGQCIKAIDERGTTWKASIVNNIFDGATAYNIALSGNQYADQITIGQNQILPWVYEAATPVSISLAGCNYTRKIDVVNNHIHPLDHNWYYPGSTNFSTTPTKTTGIEVISFIRGTNLSSTINISGNTILYTQVGISTLRTDNVIINDNQILTYPLPWQNGPTPYSVGIYSVRDRNLKVKNNYITGDYFGVGPTYTVNKYKEGKVIGILTQAEQNGNILSCNRIDATHWAIANTANFGISTSLKNNLMLFGNTGISLFQSGYVGQQGSLTTANDNEWFNNCTYPFGVYSATGAGQKFWLRAGATTYPSGIALNQEMLTFNITNAFRVASSSPSATQIDCNMTNPYLPSFRMSKYDTITIKPLDTSYVIGADSLYIAKFDSVYITADSVDERPQDTIPGELINQFEIDKKTTILNNLNTVDSIILGNGSYWEETIDNNAWGSDQLHQLIIDEPWVKDSSKIIADFIDTTYDKPMPMLLNLYDSIISNTDSSQILYRLSQNNGVSTYEKREENMKAINDIYLRYFVSIPESFWLNDSIMPNSSLTNLFAIASECYITGGPAVFEARKLYKIATGKANLDFNDYCTMESVSNKTDESGTTPQKQFNNGGYLFKLYPNLISKNGTFKVESSEDGFVSFYNSLGQLLYKVSLKAGTTTFSCYELSCESGIVSYRAQLKDSHVEAGKIVIVK